MAEAYIIDAVRTPIGRKKGSLASVHPADLGAHPIKALVERTGIDANLVDDVVWGCCDTIGPQAGDIGRTVWLVAGLPQHVPGTTIDRQCGSSQQAVHFAAQGVMSGTQDLVVAGGSAGDECNSDFGGDAGGRALWLFQPVQHIPRLGRTLWRRDPEPDQLSRNDCGEMGPFSR
jgi:acetyl-CoA acetyltransferase